ncbi:recombinase family protein [Mucilaginibacter sp. Bleaf8]|uniref:recombinase family protein n=1 Tax=Mucilaginibacter sp. Bleaf8 TaxID=2834430 RepID=UPI001BCECB94|nr:recombinase family protein [Mucilaginibacter sp. Bleaf8]MBS7565583.1 recombinase family protein [Mucilaginibacter sp. Bleaf8]
MEEKKHVGIWIRVSTDMQVKDDSPEHHERRARYYVESRDWQVVEVYRLEAVSGKTVMNHPEAQRMLKDLRSGRISGLVFSKLARLARSTKELLEFAEIFRKEGADLVSLAEQIDTSTPAGRLFFTIVAAMAEWEREEISSRVSASVPIRAKMGKPLGGQASFGYKWQDKSMVIDEKEAPIRKLMYEIFLECQRKKTTAERLNELGHRTRNGSRFSDTTIDRLLRDTTAKGQRLANHTKSIGEGRQWITKPQEEWIIIPCPSIVSEELWEKCNAVLDEQSTKRAKRGRISEYLLAGLVKCECGTPMYVFSTAKKFTCRKCKNNVRVSDMDNYYQQVLKGYLNDIQPQMYVEELEADIRVKEGLLSASLKKRTQLRKKMDELVPLRVSGDLDKEHFAEIYQPLVTQVHQLDRSIPELQAEIDLKRVQVTSADHVLKEAKGLYKAWSSMLFSQKRPIVETITEYITIGKETIDVGIHHVSSSSKLTSQHEFKGSWRPPA